MFAPLTTHGAPAIYTQASLVDLALNHLALVAAAVAAATVLAVGLAILVTRPFGADFLPLSRALANIGQTFPPIAVLALTVPVLGFGNGPTLVALFLYGLLPIFENALTGLTTLPPAVSGRRARHGHVGPPAAAAGRAAAGAAGDPRRHPPVGGDRHRHRHDRVHRRRQHAGRGHHRGASVGTTWRSSCKAGWSSARWRCLTNDAFSGLEWLLTRRTSSVAGERV